MINNVTCLLFGWGRFRCQRKPPEINSARIFSGNHPKSIPLVTDLLKRFKHRTKIKTVHYSDAYRLCNGVSSLIITSRRQRIITFSAGIIRWRSRYRWKAGTVSFQTVPRSSKTALTIKTYNPGGNQNDFNSAGSGNDSKSIPLVSAIAEPKAKKR